MFQLYISVFFDVSLSLVPLNTSLPYDLNYWVDSSHGISWKEKVYYLAGTNATGLGTFNVLLQIYMIHIYYITFIYTIRTLVERWYHM